MIKWIIVVNYYIEEYTKRVFCLSIFISCSLLTRKNTIANIDAETVLPSGRVDDKRTIDRSSKRVNRNKVHIVDRFVHLSVLHWAQANYSKKQFTEAKIPRTFYVRDVRRDMLMALVYCSFRGFLFWCRTNPQAICRLTFVCADSLHCVCEVVSGTSKFGMDMRLCGNMSVMCREWIRLLKPFNFANRNTNMAKYMRKWNIYDMGRICITVIE